MWLDKSQQQTGQFMMGWIVDVFVKYMEFCHKFSFVAKYTNSYNPEKTMGEKQMDIKHFSI